MTQISLPLPGLTSLTGSAMISTPPKNITPILTNSPPPRLANTSPVKLVSLPHPLLLISLLSGNSLIPSPASAKLSASMSRLPVKYKRNWQNYPIAAKTPGLTISSTKLSTSNPSNQNNSPNHNNSSLPTPSTPISIIFTAKIHKSPIPQSTNSNKPNSPIPSISRLS